ncbi:hypothetical protein GQX74_003171 [Glossina fuscipes]|nr:hypothetical protein GQX74_003171 [Glossina fuscipes]
MASIICLSLPYKISNTCILLRIRNTSVNSSELKSPKAATMPSRTSPKTWGVTSLATLQFNQTVSNKLYILRHAVRTNISPLYAITFDCFVMIIASAITLINDAYKSDMNKIVR